MALADHLGAHQDARRRRVEAAQERWDRPAVRGRVGVEPEDRQRREQARELVLETLGAGAVAGKGNRAAVGAGRRHDLGVAAVVARDPAARPVQHQGDVALAALPHAPARPAGEEVRPTPPVEKDDRLLPPVPDRPERLERLRMQNAARLE